MASPTTTAQLTAFMPQYWDQVLGENLYPNLYFYQFGTKRSVPRNFGTSIKIPRIKKNRIVTSLTEGTIVGTCPISDQFISGTMAQYGGAYKHSDVLIMTNLSDVIELSLIEIARDIARRIDRSVRNALSANGFVISDALASNPIKPTHIMEAVVRLDSSDNPRPPDNHFPAIIHPTQVFSLQNNLSGGAWLDVIKYTEGNVNRAYIGEVGKLYGARFTTSNNIRRRALSAALSGVENYMFAPDAYYVSEISDMTTKTIVKQLGSGGTSDPLNQIATVGAKAYFGIVPATWGETDGEYRYMRLKFHSTKFTTAGDTVA